jgi:hypothetical protein
MNIAEILMILPTSYLETKILLLVRPLLLLLIVGG